ncbi:MAG: hypothetical protein RIF36_04335 [Imperialibacter sp.]|uniref:hypothetical protein n=1 Tax=Imperialibacter sp. TaxID=2038411 RepID=UPI0032EB319A
MKLGKKIDYLQILLFLLTGTLLWSCLGEVEPYEKEPAVKVRFFNIDSLQKINSAIAAIDTAVKHLTAEKTALTTQLSALNTSLTSLNKQITEGNNDLIPERDSVQAAIAEARARQTEITTEQAALAAAKTPLTKTAAAINKGTILISSITANGNKVSYSDSANTFSLPLNMNASSQVYYFEIAGKVDSMELTYSFVEDLTAKSYTRLIGTNIERTDDKFSFDSVKVYCKALPDPCLSTKTTVNVYF